MSVITIDNIQDKEVQLGKVLEMGGEEVTVHYYGTTDEDPKKAEFSLAYIDKRGKTILGRKPNRKEGAKPWTGIIPLDEELILGRATFYNTMMSMSTKRRLHKMKMVHKFMFAKKKRRQKKRK